MSDHVWAQEHIAAAVADGLSAQETERLTAHVCDCPECFAALHDARTLNDRLGSLFAPARPGPMLEDRVIKGLREATARRRRMSGWRRRLAIGLAASVGIGAAGVAAEQLIGSGLLPSLSLSEETSGRREIRLHEALPGARVASAADRNADTMANELGNRLNANLDGRVNIVDSSNSIDGRSNANAPAWTQPQPAPLPPASEKAPNSASSGGDHKNLPTYQYKGPVGLNGQTRLEDKQNAPAQWNDSVPPGAAQSLSQGIPDARGLGILNGLTNPGPNGYFSVWGTSSYANNGQVYLGVDQTVTDGGPGKVGDISGKVNGRPWANFNSQFNVPPPTNETKGQGAGQATLSLGYVNPADMKPTLPGAEPQQGRGRSTGGLEGGERGEGKGGEQLDRSGKLQASPPRPAQQLTYPQPTDAAPAPEPAAPRKIVIRSGEMEFEVESFDSAVATITKLVLATPGAYVATVNSDKLPNGRVKGSIALRVPPERLDSLVLDLRKELGKGGELKGQKIGSQDITKQYTDLESRLRAARTMEARLLQMIKEGKGEIKQLLEAEKELGTWRTKIEECEGELRYFGNLVALSTLTIALEEKGIRAAAAITECERVQTGIEVEDVDKALQAALAAVAEANGRVTKSELKQLAAGQFNATLHCELAPTAAGPFRDRLSQQGRVARLEIDRVQTNEGGTVARDAKVKRGDTQFLVQFYNLANVAPREVRTVLVAVPDVPAGYQSLREAVGKTRGRVLNSQLNEQDRQNVTAQLDFEVPRADEAALSGALAAAGEVVARNATRATDGENLTDAKVLFRTALVSALRLRPRETTTLAVEVPDVDGAVAVLKAQVGEANGRSVDVQAAHERGGRVTARLIYDVPLSAASALVEKAKAAGIVRVQQSAQDQQAPDGKLATARLDVTLSNTDLIVAKDDGVWPQVRRGLSLSALVLLTSLTWVVFGLCVVLPWAMVGYGGYRVFRWLVPKAAAAPAAAATST